VNIGCLFCVYSAPGFASGLIALSIICARWNKWRAARPRESIWTYDYAPLQHVKHYSCIVFSRRWDLQKRLISQRRCFNLYLISIHILCCAPNSCAHNKWVCTVWISYSCLDRKFSFYKYKSIYNHLVLLIVNM
jgi:hypothetical protein